MGSFTCYGEVLWDIFQDHEKIGGAPLNVALRLKSFKNDVAVISSVGNDLLGEKLVSYLIENNLETKFIQTHDTLSTGKVQVTLDENGSACYEIKQPVAWDNIKTDDQTIKRVIKSEVFIFGSLVCRNTGSEQALFQLLKHANFKVFDVNLRPPFYNFNLLKNLMEKADFIKFNDSELDLITTALKSGTNDIKRNMIFIADKFKASHICVTLGSKGALLLINGAFYSNSGYHVKVKDTVGAGDSFLATLLHGIIGKRETKDALDFACAVGALVAGSEGANPKISEFEIEKMINT